MKKIEIALLVMIILAAILDSTEWPGGTQLLFLALSFTAFFYLLFSFALFNGVGLRRIFVKSAYSDSSSLRIIGSILMGIVLSAIVFGIIFTVFRYEGAQQMLFLGLTPCLVVVFVSIYFYVKNKAPFHKRILLRILLLGIPGALAFLGYLS